MNGTVTRGGEIPENFANVINGCPLISSPIGSSDQSSAFLFPPSLSILVDRREGGALGKQGDNQADGNEWIGTGRVGESLCGTDLGKAQFLEPPLIDGESSTSSNLIV